MKTKIGLLGLVMTFLFISCSEEDQTDTPMTTDDLTVNAYMDEMSDDVSKIALDQYVKASTHVGKNGELTKFLPDCATISFADTQNNWIRTIDFGSEGCEMKNGNILKGKITISGSTDYQMSVYSISCSFDKFYHNGNLIEGSKTLVRTIESTPNLETAHPVLTINLDLKVTSVNGVVRTTKGTRVREMIAGFDTLPLWMDDVFLISGTQTVTSPKGQITATVTAPLTVNMNCNHIVQGAILYTKKDKTATLDYGDGTCDNEATCTINGIEKPISLGTK